jgi:signal transduction histidine kinase
LLDNAVKYSPAGSTITVRLAGLAATDGGSAAVTLEVTDQGTGMAEETVSHAFEQFYRSDQARRLAPDGSGVGLYAARGLVEAMGGTIAMRSQLGVGTTVAITLPGERADAGPADSA